MFVIFLFLTTSSSVAKQAEVSYLSLPGYHLDAPFRSSEFLKLGRISLSTEWICELCTFRFETHISHNTRHSSPFSTYNVFFFFFRSSPHLPQSQSGQRGEPSTAGCHSCHVEVSSWTGSRWVQQKIFDGVSGRVVIWMFSPERFKSQSLVHDL